MAAWAVTVMATEAAGRTSCVRQARFGWASLPLSARSSPWAPSARFRTYGDGGIGYHIADLETALRIKTP